MSEVVKKARPIKCTVVSDKTSQTRVGLVERLALHSQYHKYIRRSTKIMFHDAENKSKEGDVVLVSPCKPMSARKKFNLHEIIESAPE